MGVVVFNTERYNFSCGEGNCLECPLVQHFYGIKYVDGKKTSKKEQFYHWCPFYPEDVWVGFLNVPESNPSCPCKNRKEITEQRR